MRSLTASGASTGTSVGAQIFPQIRVNRLVRDSLLRFCQYSRRLPKRASYSGKYECVVFLSVYWASASSTNELIELIWQHDYISSCHTVIANLQLSLVSPRTLLGKRPIMPCFLPGWLRLVATARVDTARGRHGRGRRGQKSGSILARGILCTNCSGPPPRAMHEGGVKKLLARLTTLVYDYRTAWQFYRAVPVPQAVPQALPVPQAVPVSLISYQNVARTSQ